MLEVWFSDVLAKSDDTERTDHLHFNMQKLRIPDNRKGGVMIVHIKLKGVCPVCWKAVVKKVETDGWIYVCPRCGTKMRPEMKWIILKGDKQ